MPLLQIADNALIRAVSAAGGSARTVQQLLQRGTFALKTLQLQQIGGR